MERLFLCRWHARVSGCLRRCREVMSKRWLGRNTHTHDSAAKKEGTMNVRNRRLKRASGFFSSARASSLEPVAEGLRWKLKKTS